MLVLSRKKNDSIQINDDITIVVVAINGDKVKLGFLASKDHQIHRQEVYDKIQAHGSCRTVDKTPGHEV
jgi:carbon storage regulator